MQRGGAGGRGMERGKEMRTCLKNCCKSLQGIQIEEPRNKIRDFPPDLQPIVTKHADKREHQETNSSYLIISHLISSHHIIAHHIASHHIFSLHGLSPFSDCSPVDLQSRSPNPSGRQTTPELRD
eukprot:763584-Hanusia_phi.AAC.6